MNIVSIKELESMVECSKDGTAQHVFNVKNATDSDIQVKLLVDAIDSCKGEWLQLDGPNSLELKVDAIANVPVTIKVPADCPPGKYSFRLRAFDPDNRTERFTDGEPVFFQVSKSADVEHKESFCKKNKWCWPAVISASVLIVVGIVIALWPSGSNVPYVVDKKVGDALFMIGQSGVAFDTNKDIKYVVNKSKVGIVVNQAPDPSKDPDVRIKSGEGMTITVGKAATTIPPRITLPKAQIMTLQKFSTLKLGTIRSLEDEAAPPQ